MSTHQITFRHVDEKKKSLIMQNRGGQSVIARILKAYGFSSRQAFCNHLGISQSTMANRYARDTFPADWVVICSMETGVPVEWLAFGTDTEKGRITNNAEKVTTIVTASINISIENKTSKMRTFLLLTKAEKQQ